MEAPLSVRFSLSRFFFFFLVALGLHCFCVGFLYLQRAGATLLWGTQASHCTHYSLVAEHRF